MIAPDAAVRRSPLLGHYELDPARHHELLDADGELRPHWGHFMAGIERSGPAQMRHRLDLVARQIRENGVTYNVYADAKGADRPWELDLLPQIIEADDWEVLAAGVAQRARLLDRVLADLYGAQTLLAGGLLPPELIFGHDHFLWPCQGVVPPGGRHLHLYAADLARAPDGRWWVVADRTQAPSGAGYAVENRQIISRAFPETFRDLRVQDIGGFFRILQTTLEQFAPASVGESPLVVLLTPGRFNETYFEHVYLARLLGMPLVEGQDLIVRADTVFMKTLGGLRRVHAILRRVDDDFCDPLELRDDSALGVPGLLAAVRAGRVLVANALGSGVLESPGLLGFLPAVCERLLGEPMALPAVATWWCGEPPVCAEALAELQRLVVKPAFPARRADPLFGPELGRSRLNELRARIAAAPGHWVAQELVQLSQAPVWQRQHARGAIVPRAISLRVYAVATPDGGYQVMPGALSRIAAKAGAPVVSMQRGGGSKDTWVLAPARAAGAEPPQRRPLGARDIIRRDQFLPSRLIENLFWTGRYAERSEDTTRLLRVVLARYVETAGGTTPALAAALDTCRHLELVAADRPVREALFAAVTDASSPNSLASVLAGLFWSAAQVRGRLSQENWRGLVEIQRETQALTRDRADLGETLDLLNRVLMATSALAGFAFDDMTRDDGWRFLVIGRRIERLQFVADVTAWLLRHRPQADAATLEWLLELADSIITYRMRYLSPPQLIPTLDLIVCDPANPHSVVFQALELARELGSVDAEFGSRCAERFAAVAGRLGACDLSALEESLFGEGLRADAGDAIADLLAGSAAIAREVSDELALRHFAHVDVSQPTVSA